MFAPINVNTLGQFVEKSYGKIFEYAAATERHLFPPATGGRNIDYPHVVYVGPFAEQRFALVAIECHAGRERVGEEREMRHRHVERNVGFEVRRAVDGDVDCFRLTRRE